MSAYYLCKNPLNKVTMLEKERSAALPTMASSLSGDMFQTNDFTPKTWKSIFKLAPGLVNMTSGQCVFRQCMYEPGFSKFLFYYITQRKRPEQKDKLKDLLQLSQRELEKLIDELGIKPQHIRYEKDGKTYTLYTKDNVSDLAKLKQEAQENGFEVIDGKESIEKELLSKIPENKEKLLLACDLAVRRNQVTLNTYKLSNRILQELQGKENFKLISNSEVNRVGREAKTRKALNVSIMGKFNSQIPCDMLIITAGANTANFIYDNFRVFSPLTPLKQYGLMMSSQSSNTGTHLIFDEAHLSAA